MVVEHNWWSSWTHPVGEYKDAPLGGLFGETMVLEDREPTINSPPYRLQHSNRIDGIERSWLMVCRKRVGSYDTPWHWGYTQMHGSRKSWREHVRPKDWKDGVCNFVVWYDEMKMRLCISTLMCAQYILAVALSTSITPVLPAITSWKSTFWLWSSEYGDALGD